jgi:hypothetical protein
MCFGYAYLTVLYAGFGLGRGVCEHNYHSDRIAALAIYITGNSGHQRYARSQYRRSYGLLTCISILVGKRLEIPDF